jgi:MFS family permease
MLVRTYIFYNVAAVALIGLISYWDRTGTPSGPIRYLGYVWVATTYLIPISIGSLIFILCSSKFDRRNKLFAFVVGGISTFAQIVALFPTIQ